MNPFENVREYGGVLLAFTDPNELWRIFRAQFCVIYHKIASLWKIDNHTRYSFDFFFQTRTNCKIQTARPKALYGANMTGYGQLTKNSSDQEYETDRFTLKPSI